MNGNVEQAVYENLGASLLDDSNLSDHILFLKKKIDGFADEFAVRTFFILCTGIFVIGTPSNVTHFIKTN